MNLYRASLRPRTDFGTALTGDTLFGQLCWAARERLGETGLGGLLEGYVAGHPFAALSDGFPTGLLPRPAVPDSVLGREVDPARRKLARRRAWLPCDGAALPLSAWLDEARAAGEGGAPVGFGETRVLTQNTVNRMTGTTGRDEFAPRQVARIAYPCTGTIDVYVVLDESRLQPAVLSTLLADVGAAGYGRDASTGLGKFEVEDLVPWQWPTQAARSWMTLAPCAPDPTVLDPARCFHLPLTRFGRHGNVAAVRGRPYKRPVLLLATGAVLTGRAPQEWRLHGRGLGGVEAPVSAMIPATVLQGYAPVVPLNVELCA